MLVAGHKRTPLQSLKYLAVVQSIFKGGFCGNLETPLNPPLEMHDLQQ